MKKRSKIIISILALVVAGGIGGYLKFFATPNQLATQVYKTPQGREFWHYPMKDKKQSAISIVWNKNFAGLPRGLEHGALIGVRLMTDGGAGGMDAADIVSEFQSLDAGSKIIVQPEFVQGICGDERDQCRPGGRTCQYGAG